MAKLQDIYLSSRKAYKAKERSLIDTYEYLKEAVRDKKWVYSEPEFESAQKIVKALNYNIKMNWEKFGYFYRAVKQDDLLTIQAENMPRNFSYVTDQLVGSSILSRRSYFQAIKDLGLTDVITVMETPCPPDKYDGLGLTYHFFTVDDMTPPTQRQMEAMMTIIHGSSGGTVVHCRGGVGRTGTVLAAYLMWSQGLSRQEAKKILEQRKTILTDSQDQFLKDWYGYCQQHGQFLEEQTKTTDHSNNQNQQRSSLNAKLPPLIMTVGYPASGKSTFSQALVQASGGRVQRINQDEMGRKGCLDVIGKVGKKTGVTFILDRCHLTHEERMEWLGLAHNRRAWCIFFAVDPDECRWRIVRRSNHPTIRHGGGTKIIDKLKGTLEPPSLQEGFEKIIQVETFEQVNSLLEEWGCPAPEPSEDLQELDLLKFPRTRHLVNLGSATRDDLIMTGSEQAQFLNRPITVEEKIDGANLGISIQNNEIKVQNRSHYVNSSYHAQFKYLDKWIYAHSADLWQILIPERYILYGEWVYARHSIKYTNLPDWFVAFDLYDRLEGKFWSRTRLEKLLEGTKISLIPLLTDKQIFKKPEELAQLVHTPSQFCEGPVEGAYCRICDDDWLVTRGKIVRSDFITGNEFWSKGGIDPNRLTNHRYI